ncbi:MAG: hypothetical protein O3A51_06665 [Verrucomicrobia bacterium]|nr:hypothetical protein [Verrucomicrobiota bacterium]
MKKLWIAGLVVLATVAANAFAIDRGAAMIDTVSVDLQELNDVDGAGISIWVENLLAAEREDWAIIAGGSIGQISPDGVSSISPVTGAPVTVGASNVDYWTLGLGIKFYLAPITSFSAVGTYSQFDQSSVERDAKAVTFTAKQRLLPATHAVSPYAKGTYSIRERSTFSDPGTSGSFSENVFALGGGVEFMAADNFSFIFEAMRVESDNSKDNAEDLDGWLGTFAMQYYFDKK